jgi:dephospho-CoA kinase
MSTESGAGPRRAARRPPADDGLFIVGLVGPTGSGKSLVADALAADGATVLSGDEVGHEVTDRDPAVRAALMAEYGTGVYGGDGRLDRARVAARVFGDPLARARLDRLVQPRLVARIAGRLAALRRDGVRGVVVIDAALLLEWGFEGACDAVIAVVAPPAERLRRLERQRGWTEEEARRRLGAQRDDEAFRAAADVTLDNSGSAGDLVQAARAAIATLRAGRAAERG